MKIIITSKSTVKTEKPKVILAPIGILRLLALVICVGGCQKSDAIIKFEARMVAEKAAEAAKVEQQARQVKEAEAMEEQAKADAAEKAAVAKAAEAKQRDSREARIAQYELDLAKAMAEKDAVNAESAMLLRILDGKSNMASGDWLSRVDRNEARTERLRTELRRIIAVEKELGIKPR